jgi:hypothetical protein
LDGMKINYFLFYKNWSTNYSIEIQVYWLIPKLKGVTAHNSVELFD